MNAKAIAAVMIVCAALAAGAQDSGEAGIGRIKADYSGGLFDKGGHTMTLSTGAQLPLFILPRDSGATLDSTLKVGGNFSLSYQYFVANHLAIGGTFAGAFNGTVGGRNLFIAPLSFRTAYWAARLPWEYFAAAEVGGSIMRLSGNGMITPFAKAGGGVLYQISKDWSVGVQSYYWFVPELHTGSQTALTRYGNFLEIALAAVYHL
jgi:hypothetical protein